jgi:hypothetical protein
MKQNQHQVDDGAVTPARPAGAPPPAHVMCVLLLLDVLLMAFSITSWLLANATLAATAGRPGRRSTPPACRCRVDR